MPRSKAFKRVLVLPDLHLRPAGGGVPSGEDIETLAAVEQYVGCYAWDEVVLLGDLMDLDCISAHNSHKPRLVEGKRLQADFDYANEWLDRWTSLIPVAKWTLIEGNHDERLERYMDAWPAMAGKLEMDRNLCLTERGINWVRYWTKGELYSIGNAYFGHGRSAGKYHAEKMVADYGVCIYGGHTHDVMEMPKVLLGKDKTLVGKTLGCLCRYDQPYMKGKPSKWQQAFAVFHFWPNGFFNEYTVKCFSGGFVSPEGDFYERKERKVKVNVA